MLNLRSDETKKSKTRSESKNKRIVSSTTQYQSRRRRWPSKNLVVMAPIRELERQVLQADDNLNQVADTTRQGRRLQRQQRAKVGNRAAIVCRSGTCKLKDRRHHHQESRTGLHHKSNLPLMVHLRTVRSKPQVAKRMDSLKDVIINHHSPESRLDLEHHTSSKHQRVNKSSLSMSQRSSRPERRRILSRQQKQH